MLRRIVMLVGFVALFALPVPPAQAGLKLSRYIVVFEDDVVDPQSLAVAHSHAYQGVLGRVFDSALKGYSVVLSAREARALSKDSQVAFVTPDGPVQAFEDTPTGVARIGASHVRASGAPAVPVPVGIAVLDTGIDPSHPDLNVAGGVDCTMDPLGGLLGGLLGGGKKAGTDDGNGHGTHVAGTAAAKGDGSGVVGVAPGAPVYAVRVFNSLGSGTLSEVVCGLDWVAKNASTLGIKVVNMSLGAPGTDDGNCGATSKDAFHAAVCRVVASGVTVVVAAGNSSSDFVGTVPAAYDEVLTVSAMADFDGKAGGGATSTCKQADVDDSAADFSNFTMAGSPDEGHLVAAPGVCIYSTWKNGAYETISGTSMASPHVAGLVARCIAAGPCADLTPAQVIARLRSDAATRSAGSGFEGDPSTPIEGRYYGFLIDAGSL